MASRPSLVKRVLRAIRHDQRGGTAIEYGLICALIVIAMIAALMQLAGATIGMWNNISDKVTTASPRS